MRIRIVLTTLAALAAAGACAILGVEERPARGGSYREAVVGQPLSLNPLLHPADPVARDMARLMHAGLVRVTEGGDIRGELATGWTSTPDGLSYTFAVDPRATWHDGQAVTAADVLATVRFLQSPTYPGPWELATLWRGVRAEAVDAHSVRFTLAEPYASFIEACSVPVLPATVLGSDAGDDPDSPRRLMPPGAGPFRLQSIAVEGAVLERHPGYRGPQPLLDRIDFRFYPDREAALGALARGDVEGFAGLSAGDAAELWARGRLVMREAVLQGHQTILFFNHRQPILADLGVRRALALGIARQALLRDAPDSAVPVHGPIPAYSWAYSRDVEREPDPGLATRLLEDAGWRGSPIRSRAGRPLQLRLVVPQHDRSILLGYKIAEQLSAVGFRIDVQSVEEIDLYRERILPREYDLALLGVWLGSVDPDPFPLWHSSQRQSGLNLAEYANPTVDRLLASARADGDPGRRLAALREFQRVWTEDVPSIVIASPVLRYAISDQFRGVRLGIVPEPGARFQYVSEWHTRTGWELRVKS